MNEIICFNHSFEVLIYYKVFKQYIKLRTFIGQKMTFQYVQMFVTFKSQGNMSTSSMNYHFFIVKSFKVVLTC